MHKILKQTVELSMSDEIDAVTVQARISSEFQGNGLRELERVFNRHSGDSNVLRVDRMELDLGEICGDDWMMEFLRRLAQCSEKALSGTGTESAMGVDTAAGDPAGMIESLSERSQEQADLEALAIFLCTGRLPWWSDLETGDEAWIRKECNSLTPIARRSLIDLVSREPRALQRLVIRLRAPDIAELLRDRLPVGLASSLTKTIKQLESYLALPPMRLGSLHVAYWQPFFRFAREDTAGLNPQAIVREWFGHLNELTPRFAESLDAQLDGSASGLNLPREWQDAFAKALHQTVANRRDLVWSEQQEPAQPDGAKLLTGKSANPDESSARQPPDTPTAPRVPPIGAEIKDTPFDIVETDEVAEIFVAGAGMVLLHPFLGELFKHLRLVDKGQFVDEDARQIAVQLLGYLTFGPDIPQEPELTLAKLLCGMPLDEVLLPATLSATALENADELLAAVLKHWAALKTSSVHWLREQFMLRSGKLEQVDAGWKLVVESRAQDVLLSKLPWGLGVISLPWLDTMLYVSWGE